MSTLLESFVREKNTTKKNIRVIAVYSNTTF